MKEELKKVGKYGLGAYAAGTFGQIIAESQKALFNIDPEKFPNGLADINLIEESLEGGLSALAGAYLGYALYQHRLRKVKIQESVSLENKYILYAGIASYSSMAFIFGPVLHEITGTADVKWGPFS